MESGSGLRLLSGGRTGTLEGWSLADVRLGALTAREEGTNRLVLADGESEPRLSVRSHDNQSRVTERQPLGDPLLLVVLNGFHQGGGERGVQPVPDGAGFPTDDLDDQRGEASGIRGEEHHDLVDQRLHDPHRTVVTRGERLDGQEVLGQLITAPETLGHERQGSLEDRLGSCRDTDRQRPLDQAGDELLLEGPAADREPVFDGLTTLVAPLLWNLHDLQPLQGGGKDVVTHGHRRQAELMSKGVEEVLTPVHVQARDFREVRETDGCRIVIEAIAALDLLTGGGFNDGRLQPKFEPSAHQRHRGGQRTGVFHLLPLCGYKVHVPGATNRNGGRLLLAHISFNPHWALSLDKQGFF